MSLVRALDHVRLRVADLDEAAARWCVQFGLTEAGRAGDVVRLACDDEPAGLELRACGPGEDPGLEHVAWELAADVGVGAAAAHLGGLGLPARERTCGFGEAGVDTCDADRSTVRLLAHRGDGPRPVAHARPGGLGPAGRPRRLGHVNLLTPRIEAQLRLHIDALGLRLTDRLGEAGAWMHLAGEHHELAFVSGAAPHLHHVAFDVVDVGQMRMALDHLGRHGRWVSWGPTRHGVGGNVATYVRIAEEACHVELYCDMERLAPDHRPRVWPDDRYSSNTWGPLPPRSYFRFDADALAWERASRETLGEPLPPLAPGTPDAFSAPPAPPMDDLPVAAPPPPAPDVLGALLRDADAARSASGPPAADLPTPTSTTPTEA